MAGEGTRRSTGPAGRKWRGRTEYFAAYDAVLARWPVAFESVDVRGPFGVTHVRHLRRWFLVPDHGLGLLPRWQDQGA